MNNANYKIVLSDKLFSIYKKASTQEQLNTKEKKIYEKLIGHLELDILTNIAQLERCKETHNLPSVVFDDLYPVLLNSDDKNLSLNELSSKTLYQLILTQADDKTEPPYFNIKSGKISRKYIITRSNNQDRNYLASYLKNLLNNASSILIYDPFFSKHEENKRLSSLLPDKYLKIFYIENGDANNGKFIKEICKKNIKWSTEKCDTTLPEFNRYARSHDRYLVIDNKLEITITSGFYYIWKVNKEITCIFKEL